MSLFTFKNLEKAYKNCKKHKSLKLNTLSFEYRLLDELMSLEDELKSKTYTPSRSICFLCSSPKLREVFAATFRDRVIHHLIIDIIEPFYEKRFIFDTYNNRLNKGTHKGVQRLQHFIRANPKGYYLQLDIKGFFYNLNKDILFNTLKQDIKKEKISYKDKDDVLWLLKTIIYHNPTKNYHFKGNRKTLKSLPEHKSLFKLPENIGLPIGNITSQFFANVYLNKFDHFIKRELKCKYYLRYVDDFILIDNSKENLLILKEKIEHYLKNNLNLSLREDSKLKNVKEGVDFLGYITREFYILSRKRVIRNYQYKKAKYLSRYEKLKGNMGLKEIKHFLSIRASFLAHIKHCNGYNLKQNTGVINESKYYHFFFNHKQY